MTIPDYQAALGSLAQADDRFIVLTAENRAPLRGLPAVLGERFVDVGIAEQTLVGAAAGLALRGRIPVAHALAAFLTMRPFEFIRTDAGIPGLPVKLVGSIPGLLSEANGSTHQALEDVALMRAIPGMGIFCPADEEDLALGLEPFLKGAGPGYLRLNQRPAFTDHAPFVLGMAEVLRDGRDVGILVYGTLAREASEAAQRLGREGISVRLLNLRTLAPLDAPAVLETARRTRMLVTIEDHFRVGGLHAIVAELLLENRTPADVLGIDLGHRWFRPGLLREVLEAEGLTGEALAERILTAWFQKGHDA